MIAFGSAIPETESYRRYAKAGIDRVAEPDSEVFAYRRVGSISRSYNLLIDAAARRKDLEALVLVHPRAEIIDPGFCTEVRRAFEDPAVAVLGCLGACDVRSIAWWEGAVFSGTVRHAYQEHGGGELQAFAWTQPGAPRREVETVDGWLLVLSPWAVRNVRFDESLHLNHGYDLDYCLQVRSAGRTVKVMDFAVCRHRSLEPVSALETWIEAHIVMAERWEDRIPGATSVAGDWKPRARRAEAEREAAGVSAHTTLLRSGARVLELERALAARTGSWSWRLTAPLRRLNHGRAKAAAPGQPRDDGSCW